MRTFILSLTCGIVLVAGIRETRSQVMAIESVYNPAGTYYSTPIDSTYGWRFSVGPTPLNVTHLGYFDAALDGLADSHAIGIWDNSGTLVAQGTVAAGTSAMLDGAYRFTLIPTVTLAANSRYYIGAHSPHPNDTGIAFSTTETFASGFTYETASYAATAGFAAPMTAYGASQGVFGPNFQFVPVPEPKQYAMMISLALVAFACVRRRMLQR